MGSGGHGYRDEMSVENVERMLQPQVRLDESLSTK